MAYDFVIQNANIIDGTGSAARIADVGVRGERIVDVAPNLSNQNSNSLFDAQGLTLAPGIIDSHTHFDAQVTWDPWTTPSPQHGVTTVILGNCGFTIAPCRAGDQDLTMRNLTRVEGMSLDALQAGTDWSFETVPEYFDLIDNNGVGVNVAAFVGHSSVRTYVMGKDAPKRKATDAEIATMRDIVSGALNAGAIGFSTSTSISHNGAYDPMPSRLADENELRQLVATLGDHGRGVFMLTKGPDTSIEFLESLAAETNRPVMVAALLHNSSLPQATFDDLAAIGQAQGRGRPLWGQVSCCPLTTLFTMQAPYPFEGVDAWKPALSMDSSQMRVLFADQSFRDAVKKDLETPIAVRLFNGEWSKVSVVETVLEKNQSLEGQSLETLAQARDAHPLDVMLDLALEENLDTQFVATLLNSDETAVGEMLSNPYSSIALSDAGAHMTFFCDAGFGLRLLGHWVRERQTLALEQAVHQLTGLPASIYGLKDRGVIRPGAYADLMLFDPHTVNRSPARRVFDLPGNAYRLTTDPVGLKAVWVNGERIVDDGELIDGASKAGQFLREFDA